MFRTAQKVASSVTVVSDTLFGPDVDPTGQVIRIRNQPFRVVGVMASKGARAMGKDQDDTVFVPYTTVHEEAAGQQHINSITVVGRDARDAPVAEAIRETLRIRHKLSGSIPTTSWCGRWRTWPPCAPRRRSTMTTLLAAIAGVSLLVGGIGIMNIMLVSVTERTREIGLRLAIGARGKDVLLQFLVEAIVISLSADCIGIGPDSACRRRWNGFCSGRRRYRPTPSGWRSGSPRATGVFFGFYPALKARVWIRSRRCGSSNLHSYV